MESGNAVSIFAAFIAGILTFISPCILPLIPAYLSYMTGISFDQLKGGKRSEVIGKSLLHAAFFTAGFSLIFVILGASVTYAGRLFSSYRGLMEKTGGALIILFGLHSMGLLGLGFLDKEQKIRATFKKGSAVSSFLLGVTFAAAWTPCVGPILGSILVLAGTRETLMEGVVLLGAFSAGIAIPFILSAVLINSFLAAFNRMKRYIGAVTFAAGGFLVFIGILLMTGRFSDFAMNLMSWISR